MEIKIVKHKNVNDNRCLKNKNNYRPYRPNKLPNPPEWETKASAESMEVNTTRSCEL